MKILSEELIREVAINTASNHHTENLVLLANQLENKKLFKAIKSLSELHQYFGEITPALSAVREDLIKNLKNQLFSEFSNAIDAWLEL